MPKEYLECVRSMQREGKKKSEAQKTCAIAYYNSHGKTPQEAAGEVARQMIDNKGAFSDIDIKKAVNPDYLPPVRLYAPITKIDEEKRMVFGYATTDAEDSHDEIVSLDATFEAADEYMEWRNIRVMHQAEAVGTAPIIEKHKGQGLYIGAEIVDDVAWKKVQKGVYKGFSIGGQCLEMDGNKIIKYKLVEISLVDRPANPESLFVVAKRADEELEKKPPEGKTGESMKDDKGKTDPTGSEKLETTPPEKTETDTSVKDKTEKSEKVNKDGEDETVSISKKKLDELVEKINKFEEEGKVKKKEEEAKKLIIKVIGELKPEMKKIFEENKSSEELAKEAVEKKSMGELTSEMLKSC